MGVIQDLMAYWGDSLVFQAHRVGPGITWELVTKAESLLLTKTHRIRIFMLPKSVWLSG